jgi:N-methylhydantoinase A
LSDDAAAAGILRLTDTSLAAAIRVSLFEKGFDPRDFTMLSFGGAGSVHACSVADELGMRRIVFPVDASTFSARGILDADIRHAFARSGVRVFDEAALPVLTGMAAEMSMQAGARLDGDGLAPSAREFRFAVDLRYRGQAFELTVPWGEPVFDAAALHRVSAAFHAMHEQRFSYAARQDVVEVVTLRLDAIGRLPRAHAQDDDVSGSGLPVGVRRVFTVGAWADVPVWRRSDMTATTRIAGPAIIEEEYTTVYLAPGWSLSRAIDGHLVAEKKEVA